MTRLPGLLALLVARMVTPLGWSPLTADVERILAMGKESPSEPLPTFLKDMMVLVEDRRFESHAGIDLRGIARAFVNNRLGKPIQGGSTLEQQLVRSITGARELTLKRKAREAVAGAVVSSRLPKPEIADLLLRHCWFGHEMIGADAYAQAKGLSIDQITVSQGADMIARIRYPEYKVCSPEYLSKIKIRSGYILYLYDLQTR